MRADPDTNISEHPFCVSFIGFNLSTHPSVKLAVAFASTFTLHSGYRSAIILRRSIGIHIASFHSEIILQKSSRGHDIALFDYKNGHCKVLAR